MKNALIVSFRFPIRQISETEVAIELGKGPSLVGLNGDAVRLLRLSDKESDDALEKANVAAIEALMVKGTGLEDLQEAAKKRAEEKRPAPVDVSAIEVARNGKY